MEMQDIHETILKLTSTIELAITCQLGRYALILPPLHVLDLSLL